MDFILNGQAHGSVASKLLASNGDVGTLRPYYKTDKQTGRVLGQFMTVFNEQTGKHQEVPLQNANATLRYDDWRLLDTQVHKVARQRLRLVGDMRANGMQFVIGNGLAKSVFSTERMTDPGEAVLSMDGLRKGNTARPEFDMVNLPLPIAHADFSFSARQVLISRNSNTPLDTSMAESASRRVAEAIEKLALGTFGSFAYGGASIYGLTTFPNRITHTITAPTATAWTPATTVTQVLAMKQKSVAKFNYGPWVLYCSTGWDEYLDRDYILTGGNVATQTLRDRLKKIDGINDVRSLDFLSGYQLLLVQQTSDTFREIIGLDFTTVQWETQGGMELNYKVMAIMVPQPRADINGNCGIVHGS